MVRVYIFVAFNRQQLAVLGDRLKAGHHSQPISVRLAKYHETMKSMNIRRADRLTIAMDRIMDERRKWVTLQAHYEAGPTKAPDILIMKLTETQAMYQEKIDDIETAIEWTENMIRYVMYTGIKMPIFRTLIVMNQLMMTVGPTECLWEVNIVQNDDTQHTIFSKGQPIDQPNVSSFVVPINIYKFHSVCFVLNVVLQVHFDLANTNNRLEMVFKSGGEKRLLIDEMAAKYVVEIFLYMALVVASNAGFILLGQRTERLIKKDDLKKIIKFLADRGVQVIITTEQQIEPIDGIHVNRITPDTVIRYRVRRNSV